MSVEVIENQDWERMLRITVDSEQVRKAYDGKLKEFSREITVKGFRKGKVPPRIAERHLDQTRFMRSIFESFAPHFYFQALDEKSMLPITAPRFEVVQLEKGKECIFTTAFKVKQEIEVTDYRGVEVSIPKHDVTDDDVLRVLADQQMRATRSVPIEDPEAEAALGRIVKIDFKSTMDGKPYPGNEAEDYSVELDRKSFVSGFVDHLIGMKKGESKEFDITFPEEYPRPEMAGMEVHFAVTVKEMRKKVVPELNDEFAKEISQFTTLDELKADIRAKIEKLAGDAARRRTEEEVLDKLAEKVTVTLEEPFVEFYLDILLNSTKDEVAERGGEWNSFLRMQNKTEAQVRDELREGAEHQAKLDLIIDAVARAEKIDVTPEELDGEIARIASYLRTKPDVYRAKAQEEGGLYPLKYQVLKRKVKEFLGSSAKVEYMVEKPPHEQGEECADEHDEEGAHGKAGTEESSAGATGQPPTEMPEESPAESVEA